MPAIETRITTAKEIATEQVSRILVAPPALVGARSNFLGLLPTQDMPEANVQNGPSKSPVFVPSFTEDNDATTTSLKGYIDGILSGAAITYTPVVTAGSGAFTTVSANGRYRQIGKLVFLQITITITTNGTAAAYVSASLPLPCINLTSVEHILAGRADAVSFKMLQGRIAAGFSTTVMTIVNYDSTYPGASGETLALSGFYETA